MWGYKCASFFFFYSYYWNTSAITRKVMCLSLSSMLQAWPRLGSDAYSMHQSIGNSVNHLNSVLYWLMFVCLLHTLIICCNQMLHIPATVSINLQFGWIDIIKLTRPMSWHHFIFVNQIFPLLQEENVWTSDYTASLPHPHCTAHPLQKVADGKKTCWVMFGLLAAEAMARLGSRAVKCGRSPEPL